MSSSSFLLEPGTSLTTLVTSVLRNVTRVLRADPPDPTLAELERLAAVSDHLLSDLGFVPGGTEQGGSVTCWRRGDLAVYIVPVSANVDARAVRLRRPVSAEAMAHPIRLARRASAE